MQAGTYGQWGALLAGGDVIYPTGYGTLITAVILKSLCLIVVVVSVVAEKETNLTHWIWDSTLYGLWW